VRSCLSSRRVQQRRRCLADSRCAAPPRLRANSIWARKRATRACWSPASGLISAMVRSSCAERSRPKPARSRIRLRDR